MVNNETQMMRIARLTPGEAHLMRVLSPAERRTLLLAAAQAKMNVKVNT